MGRQQDVKRERKDHIRQLLTKPMSGYEIAESTGYPRDSVNTYLTELHAFRRIHIAAWRVGVRSMTKLYLDGPGEDAPMPVRENMQDDEELFKRPPTVVKVQRDPLVAALFGEYRRYVIRMYMGEAA